jgi:hypothetical protein
LKKTSICQSSVADAFGGKGVPCMIPIFIGPLLHSCYEPARYR